jgi:cytochrome c-type biogenesis protein CcmH
MRARAAVLALALVLAAPAGAVQPDEVLADPALEARARALSAGLRCVVCRNESIDESNAEIARDMRIVLRERLVAGDSDAQAIAFLVERFGEYILLRPVAEGVNLILWFAPLGLLVVGLGTAAVALRRRPPPAPAPLTPEEQARLERLLER